MSSSPLYIASSEELTRVSFVVRVFRSLTRIYASYLDKTTVYMKTRWLLFLIVLMLYVVRIYYIQSFHIVTYGLGIYLLNVLIGVLSPQVDPENDVNGDEDDVYSLPVRDSEEFRPFQRRLPEFKAWLTSIKAVCISLILTCFSMLDLPVFWPILLIYFVILFILTMKQQIKKMIKYGYIPVSLGKQTYGEITRSTENKGGRGGGGGAVITASSHNILSPSVPKHLQQNNSNMGNIRNSSNLQIIHPVYSSGCSVPSYSGQKQANSSP